MRLEPGEKRRIRRVESDPVTPSRMRYESDPVVPSRMFYRVYAAQESGKRPEQEDSIAASLPEYEQERGIICVLSDGMGGLSDGKAVSETVVDTMISCFYDATPDTSPDHILLRGCVEAQEKVLAMQKQPKDRGATLAAILVRKGQCTFLSVGDSRILLWRGGGLIPLTRDQNKRQKIETQIGLGYLPPEARTDRSIRALSMFIGRDVLDRADRPGQPFSLIPGDRILLMSDGVFETLTRQEMAEVLTLPGESVTGVLIDRVLEKDSPGQDNCTVLMLECISG